MSDWLAIETAPKDGRAILARAGGNGSRKRHTWWGKTSHVPLYGWCYMTIPGNVESVDLWEPAEWLPPSG